MNTQSIQKGATGDNRMPQDLSVFLNRVGRGGEWQYYWTAETKEALWFPVGESPDLPAWNSVYFNVHPQKEKLGLYQRGTVQSVDVINHLFADLDTKDDWTQERVEALVPAPSIVLFSGGGWQAYWLLTETIKVTDEKREEMENLQEGWVKLMGSDDNAKDLARVLRVPYSFNHKYGEPRQVAFQKLDYELEYDLDDLAALVKERVKEKPVTKQSQGVKVVLDPALRTKVEEALSFLDKSRADPYGKWVEIGMALHDGFNGSEEGLALWDRWSQQSDKYQRGVCEKKWESFNTDRNDKVTLNTLFYRAEEDSGGLFSRSNGGPPALEPGSLTDTGNAQRLARKYGNIMRHNRSFKWVVWNGKKWMIDSPYALKYAKLTASSIFEEAAQIVDSEVRKRVLSWANQSLNLYRLQSMLGAAEELLHAETSVFEDNHKWLFNMENGILDLKTGELLPHDPKYFLTRVAGTHYDPNAKASKWEAFVEMIFPDEEVRKYVQKAVGYSLTGNSDERAIYFLEGEKGNNGKSTFIRALLELFGEYGKQTDIEVIQSMAHKGTTPMNEDFHNARFVATNELKADVRLDTTMIKTITGNDRIPVNPKYRDPYNFPPTHHLWIFGNHRPKPDKGDDEAFWSRMKRIVFDNPIPEEIRRPMEEVLEEFREELPGILNWAVEGLSLYLKEGWKIPGRITKDTQEYQEENDYLAQFIEDGYELDEHGKVDKNVFFDRFSDFLRQNQEEPISLKKLADRLKRFGVKVGGQGKRYYVGIRVRLLYSQPEPPDCDSLKPKYDFDNEDEEDFEIVAPA